MSYINTGGIHERVVVLHILSVFSGLTSRSRVFLICPSFPPPFSCIKLMFSRIRKLDRSSKIYPFPNPVRKQSRVKVICLFVAGTGEKNPSEENVCSDSWPQRTQASVLGCVGSGPTLVQSMNPGAWGRGCSLHSGQQNGERRRQHKMQHSRAQIPAKSFLQLSPATLSSISQSHTISQEPRFQCVNPWGHFLFKQSWGVNGSI